MTSKEALRAIGNTATKFIKSDGIGRPRIYYSIREMKKKEINIIKQSLDQLEKENEILKKAIENSNKAYDVLMQNSNIQFLNQNQENTKLKKALNILKNKEVSLETFKISADLDTYHEILKDNPFYDKLTQEEFELLKEMLEEK